MPVRVELRTAEQVEDALLMRSEITCSSRSALFVDLVQLYRGPGREHLEEAVVPDQLERDLPAFTSQLLAPVSVVLDQGPGLEPVDHLAH